MSKVIEVSDKISVSFDTAPSESDFITIEDNSGYVLIDVSDWDNLKQAVDALIFEQEGIKTDNMTDEQKQARKEQLLSWIDNLNKDG